MSVIKLSVTDIVNASECPRRFYIGYYFQGKRIYSADGSSFGSLFHRLAGEFFQAVPQASQWFVQRRESSLPPPWSRLFASFFFHKLLFPALENIQLQDKTEQLEQLADAVHYFCDYLGKQLENRPPDPLHFAQFFYRSEWKLSWQQTIEDCELAVGGRIDGLVYLADQSYHLLEYKLRPPHPGDELQLALYWWLLKQEKGIAATPLLVYLVPDFQVRELTRAHSEELISQAQQLLPQMCRWLSWTKNVSIADVPPIAAGSDNHCSTCFQTELCCKFFPVAEASASIAVPSPAIPEDEEEARRQQQRLVEVLQRFDIPVQPGEIKVGPAFMRLNLEFTPEGKVRVSNINRYLKDIALEMKLAENQELRWGIDEGFVYFEVPCSRRRTVLLTELLPQCLPQIHLSPVAWPVGVDIYGKPVVIDLADPNSCHLLIAGTTGSGKSQSLINMLCVFCSKNTRETLRLTLIDPKYGVDFKSFENHRILGNRIISDLETACECLEDLAREMEARYRIFAQGNVADIDEYNRHSTMPHMVVAIDEFADLVRNSEWRKRLESAITSLGTKARAAGIHLVLATQHPIREVILSQIKNNLPGRIAFRVTSFKASEVIIDETGAEKLLGYGDMLLKTINGLIRLQAPYIAKDKIANFIA